jgi:hypothetical protein
VLVGTFGDQNPPASTNAASGDPQQQQQQRKQHQYRRDPKLEYRLFTIAIVLANKYLDDNSYSNKAWSDVTGLELRKINIMELEFMKYIDYSLLVKEREYVVWIKWLENHIKILMIPPAAAYFNGCHAFGLPADYYTAVTPPTIDVQQQQQQQNAQLPFCYPPTPVSARKKHPVSRQQ